MGVPFALLYGALWMVAGHLAATLWLLVVLLLDRPIRQRAVRAELLDAGFSPGLADRMCAAAAAVQREHGLLKVDAREMGTAIVTAVDADRKPLP